MLNESEAAYPTDTAEDLARARRKQAAVRKWIRKTGKDGRSIKPTMKDTPMAREAWAWCEAWRNAQTNP